MYKNVLETMHDVHIYPIISLILFLVVFTAMLVWALRKDKGYLDEMAAKPLEDSEGDTQHSVHSLHHS